MIQRKEEEDFRSSVVVNVGMLCVKRHFPVLGYSVDTFNQTRPDLKHVAFVENFARILKDT